MHTEYTRLFFVCLKSFKLHSGTRYIGKWIVFLCVCLKSLRPLLNLLDVFSYLISILLPQFLIYLVSFSTAIFPFEVFFTKKTTSQVSVDGFKVSVVRLREVSVLYREFNYSKMSEKRPGPTQGT